MYRHCGAEDFSDFAAGRVLLHRPGGTNFPVRLAQEIFGRVLEHLPSREGITLYDPCCGTGYLLTVLGLLNRGVVSGIAGSDIDADALAVAGDNLALLTPAGMDARLRRIREMGREHPSAVYDEAARSATRLRGLLTGPSPRIGLFRADVLAGAPTAEMTFVADAVVADLPYGRMVGWKGDARGGVDALLRFVLPVLGPHSVVAVVSEGRHQTALPGIKRLEKQKVGKRFFALYRQA